MFPEEFHISVLGNIEKPQFIKHAFVLFSPLQIIIFYRC